MARQRPRLGIYGPFDPLPVRSTCVNTAGSVSGGGYPPLDPPQYPRCAVVGCAAHRHDRVGHRVFNRCGIGQYGPDCRLRRFLPYGVCCSSVGGAAVRTIHRSHSTAADPVLRGARCLLAVPQRQNRQFQRPPDQLRLSPYRAVPADVGYRRRRAGDRPGQVVPRADAPNDHIVKQRRRHGYHRQQAKLIDQRPHRGTELDPRHRFQRPGRPSLQNPASGPGRSVHPASHPNPLQTCSTSGGEHQRTTGRAPATLKPSGLCASPRL